MYKLENEAIKTGCPKAKYTVDKEGNFHSPNDPNGVGFLFCLASACMAWRWAAKYPHQIYGGDMCAESVDCCKASCDDCECRVGYCGQAGKPC